MSGWWLVARVYHQNVSNAFSNSFVLLVIIQLIWYFWILKTQSTKMHTISFKHFLYIYICTHVVSTVKFWNTSWIHAIKISTIHFSQKVQLIIYYDTKKNIQQTKKKTCLYATEWSFFYWLKTHNKFSALAKGIGGTKRTFLRNLWSLWPFHLLSFFLLFIISIRLFGNCNPPEKNRNIKPGWILTFQYFCKM